MSCEIQPARHNHQPTHNRALSKPAWPGPNWPKMPILGQIWSFWSKKSEFFIKWTQFFIKSTKIGVFYQYGYIDITKNRDPCEVCWEEVCTLQLRSCQAWRSGDPCEIIGGRCTEQRNQGRRKRCHDTLNCKVQRKLGQLQKVYKGRPHEEKLLFFGILSKWRWGGGPGVK